MDNLDNHNATISSTENCKEATTGKIFFEWRKVPFILPLEKVRLFVNDMEMPSLALNRDSNFEMSIPTEYVSVKLRTLLMSKTKTIRLNPNENYVCKLKYSRLTGRLKIDFYISVPIITMVKIN